MGLSCPAQGYPFESLCCGQIWGRKEVGRNKHQFGNTCKHAKSARTSRNMLCISCYVLQVNKLAVLYICMQTLTDGHGVDKLTAWGIIFENKLLLTAQGWELYPITLGEPRRSNMTNIRAYSPTDRPSCNHGTSSRFCTFRDFVHRSIESLN